MALNLVVLPLYPSSRTHRKKLTIACLRQFFFFWAVVEHLASQTQFQMFPGVWLYWEKFKTF
jgi:hypothetical protein